MAALSLPQETAAAPAECITAGGRFGAWKERDKKSCKEGKLDRAESVAHTPRLTCEACPASALPAVADFQAPETVAQAPAELLSAAASPLQRLLPDAAEASPTGNEKANVAPWMCRSYSHFLNPSRLDPTWGSEPQMERGTLAALGQTGALEKKELFQWKAF